MASIKTIKQHLWLLETLYSYGPISREKINEIWKRNRDSEGLDIPRRTLARHIEELESLFNIAIKCDSKYQYYISNPSNLQRQTIQHQLLANLQEANFLSRFRGLGSKVQVEEVPVGASYLPIIGEALEDNRTLLMTYQKFTDSEPYTVEIEPYCLKLNERRWYIVARKITEEITKTFSLDRIVKLEITENTFCPKEDFDADTYFDDFFGIFVGVNGEVEEVVIKATPIQAKYLRTLPLHKSQTEPSDCEFHYKLVITPDFENELMRIGEFIEVLEPQHLRNEVVEKIKNISEKYN